MAKNVLSDFEIVERLQAVAKHGGVRPAGRALGIDQTAVQRAVDAAAMRGLTATSKVVDEKERLKAAMRSMEQDIKRIQKEADSAESIRQTIFGLSARSPEPPQWLTQTGGKLGSRGAPCTIWSDWHYGETVRPEEVGGVNEFNAAIAAKRIQRLVDTTIDLSFNHMGRAKTTYPGVVVMLGGDMITGHIHEELLATNDRTNQQAINELTDLIAAGIEKMASAFGKVFVPCVVGNHGRDSKKPRMKGRVYTSHEWVIYTSLERYFRKDKNVQFFVPPESDAYFNVFGHRYLLTHGDSMGVKGGDGIIGALGPIMRGAIKTGRSEAQIGREFDTVVIGHWHQYLTLPGLVVNNSLKGYDEFARLALRAPYSRPSQALWFTHPEHGITAHWQVYLEPQRNVEAGAPWVQWQDRRV